MVSRKLYISDLHIGHDKIIRFDGRPFSDLEQMCRRLTANWNSAVYPCDEVYILGDMFWKNTGAAEILEKLNGNKFLIKGNHDKITSEMESFFVWIKEYGEIEDKGRKVILCHYPIAHWNGADRGSIHLYGHIHCGRDMEPFSEYTERMKARGMLYECYNVGCMMPYMDYTPRTLDEIIEYNELFWE